MDPLIEEIKRIPPGRALVIYRGRGEMDGLTATRPSAEASLPPGAFRGIGADVARLQGSLAATHRDEDDGPNLVA